IWALIRIIRWLPRPTFRRLLGGTRYAFFAAEANRSLLGRRALLRLCGGWAGWDVRVEPLRLWGLSSNLLLTLRRPEGGAARRSADADENEAGGQRVGQHGSAERGGDEGGRVGERAEDRVERKTVAQGE